MADQSTGLVVQGTPLQFKNAFAASATQALAAGTPVYVSAAGAVPAYAGGTFAQARCLGIATNPYASGVEAIVQFAGGIALTVAEWDAVLGGGSTGLTPGATYWVSDVNPGQLVSSPPAAEGHWDTAVLTAVSATVAILLVGSPVPGGDQ